MGRFLRQIAKIDQKMLRYVGNPEKMVMTTFLRYRELGAHF